MKQSSKQGLLAAGVLAAVLAVGAGLALATEEGRAPRMGGLSGVSADGRTLHFSALSCHGDPEAEVVSEDSRRVLVRLESDVQTGDNDGCADSVSVQLAAPLGDRQVIDAATGEPALRHGGTAP